MRTIERSQAILVSLVAATATFVLVAHTQATPVLHDQNFQMQLYATLPSPIDGLAYTSGGSFSAGLYAATRTDHAIHYFSGPGSSSLFASGLPHDRYEPVFDTTGNFGGDLFVASIESDFGPGDSIVRIDPGGNVSTFFTSGANQLDGYSPAVAFGPPGSGFLPELHIVDYEHGNLNTFDPSGNRTAGVGPISLSVHQAKDLEFGKGGAWGQDAYVLDAEARRILRVGADNSWTIVHSWATGVPSLRSIAFDPGVVFGGDLFGGANGGSIIRIDPGGIATTFISGLAADVMATEFGDNELFIGTTLGEIYRVTLIPEPGSMWLLGLGVLGIARRRR